MMAEVSDRLAITDTHAAAARIDKAGWGITLIWIGAAIFFRLSWEAGLAGFGLIILGGQLARRFFAMPADGFALILGTCLVLVGLQPVLGLRLGEAGLLPILSIGLGIAFLISAMMRRQSA
jgi:hypothetical protein